MTTEQPPKQHRRPGKPLGTFGGSGQVVVLYFALLFASGATAIRLIITHAEAWWWLKALAAIALFVLLVALGAWLARSIMAVTWRRVHVKRKPK